MVPMVDTAEQARAIVDPALRMSCRPREAADHLHDRDAAGDRQPRCAACVEGVDVFFIGPGDLSQNMGYPPAPPFGESRPQAVIERVAFAVKKIGTVGKLAGTLVTSDELPCWLEHGVGYFYTHSDPFIRIGSTDVKRLLGR